jgi:hypothetical protein
MEVTVLVPVRDGARWLTPTLRSLRRLRAPEGTRVELLFVDDGSTDTTAELLETFAARDARARVLHLRPSGLVSALNVGLEQARGVFIARCDADDAVAPTRLQVQWDAAVARDWDVVGSAIRCFPRATLTRGLVRYEAWQNALLGEDEMARERFIESPLVHPSVLMRRATVLAAGGYEERGWPEDWDLWLRLFARGARFGKVPQVLTAWRDHGSRLTRTAPHCSLEALSRCRVHHLLEGPLRDRPRIWIAGTGDDGKRLALDLVAAGATLAGWLDLNPRRLGQRIHGAPVMTLEQARPVLGRGAVVLGAVGAPGGRDALRAAMTHTGLVETRDWWCVA